MAKKSRRKRGQTKKRKVNDGWYDRYWYPGQIMYYVEGAEELIPKAGINNAGKVVKY